MKKILCLILMAFGFSAHADYDATSLLSYVRKEKVPVIRRISQPALLQTPESKILRVFILEKMTCEIPSDAARAFCIQIARAEELNEQTVLSFESIPFRPETFQMMTQALVGILEGLQPIMSEEGSGRARRLLVLLGSVLSRPKDQAVAADLIAREFESEPDLISEVLQDPGLKSFLPLIQDLLTWMKRRPVGPSLTLHPYAQEVRTDEDHCILKKSGDPLACYQAKPPFAALKIDPRLTWRLFQSRNGAICAEQSPPSGDSSSYRCWGGPQFYRSLLRGEEPCRSSDWSNYWTTADSKSTAVKFEIACDDERRYDVSVSAQGQILDVRRQSITVETNAYTGATEERRVTTVEPGDRVVGVFNRSVVTLSPKGELRSLNKDDFKNFPSRNIEQWVSNNYDRMCALERGGGWTCRMIRWDRSLGKEGAWAPKDYRLPRGEIHFQTGFHSVAEKTVYYATNDGQVHQFARPPGSSAFVFFSTLHKDDDFLGFRQRYCDIEDEKVVCRERETQKRLDHPLMDLEGVTLLRSVSIETSEDHPAGSAAYAGSDGIYRGERSLCASSNKGVFCATEKSIGEPPQPSLDSPWRFNREKISITKDHESHGRFCAVRDGQLNCNTDFVRQQWSGVEPVRKVQFTPDDPFIGFLGQHNLCWQTVHSVECREFAAWQSMGGHKYALDRK